MELLKDFDCVILYHNGKANVVVDALSRKYMGSLAHIVPKKRQLAKDVLKLKGTGVKFSVGSSEILLTCVQAKSSLVERIKTAQYEDEQLCRYRDEVTTSKCKQMIVECVGMFRLGNRLCVPDEVTTSYS